MDAENQKQGGGVEMSQLQAEFDANKEKVIDLLVDTVINVDISIPRVVCGNFEEQ